MRPERSTPVSSIVFGAAVLAAGVIFWFDRIGSIEARDFLHYWPWALVAMGIAALLEKRWFAALAWLVAGVVFLVDLEPWMIFGVWPLLISIAGITLVVQAFRPPSAGAEFNAVAVAGANSRTIGSQQFTGGQAVAVMGGCEIDLSSAQLSPAGEAIIDVLVYWGGVEIAVPNGWRVVSRVAVILGGYEDKTAPATENAPRLIIRGSVIMGGVEVRNA